MIIYTDINQIPKWLKTPMVEKVCNVPDIILVWLTDTEYPDKNMVCIENGKNCTCTKETLTIHDKIFKGKRKCSWYYLEGIK